jgi:Uma2 family endonuclease
MIRSSIVSSSQGAWSLEDVQHLVLEGVSWELYEHLLKEIGERPLRLTYDNGELEIMSPLPEHEIAKAAVVKFVDALVVELDIPYQDLGSTTFRRQLKKRGLEPDGCFYLQSQPLIAGKRRINLPKDPPPDLAIEIDITSRSIARLPIYAALGVPEIWRYDGRKLYCLHLTDGEYVQSDFSLAFPKLRVNDLQPFIAIAEEKGDQTAALKSFRKWLKKQAWIK